MVISPTVGRVVWFRPLNCGPQPYAAFVTYVWNDRLVNVGGFDHNGAPFKMTSVPLLQEGDPIPGTPYAQWMPYQIGQAKKNA